MDVYTSVFSVSSSRTMTSFVSCTVSRAGGGCFGLAIQHNGAVHYLTSPVTIFNAWRTRERTYPINMMGKVSSPNAIIVVAKSIKPFSPLLFCFVLL
jgi:hypothetical protein